MRAHMCVGRGVGVIQFLGIMALCIYNSPVHSNNYLALKKSSKYDNFLINGS